MVGRKIIYTIGVGAIAPLDAEILFDGSRYLLDKMDLLGWSKIKCYVANKMENC